MPRPEVGNSEPIWTRIEGLPIIGVFIVVIGVFMITAPESFLGLRIYATLSATVVPPLILALGLTMVIAAGEIDLSFPSVLKLSSLVFVVVSKFGIFPLDEGEGTDKSDLLIWAAFALALAVGGLIGFINGLLVVRVGIPSIIATLATLFVWEGATVISSGGLSYNIRGVSDYSLYHVLTGRIGLIPVQFFWAVALAVLTWFILNRHKFGEHLLFIGDNANVARVVGVNVGREKIKLFTLMGMFSALAGIVLTLENKNYFTTQGTGFLLVALAAVFIGGTSISGGKGSVVGTFFGSFIVGSLEAGIVASGVGGFWTRLVVGLVFIAAVTIHIVLDKAQGSGTLARLPGPSRRDDSRTARGPPASDPIKEPRQATDPAPSS